MLVDVFVKLKVVVYVELIYDWLLLYWLLFYIMKFNGGVIVGLDVYCKLIIMIFLGLVVGMFGVVFVVE